MAQAEEPTEEHRFSENETSALLDESEYHHGKDRGDEDEPQFTLRAAVAGLAIGFLLALTNTYFGLQTGWISMMSLQASILGFILFKLIRIPGMTSRPFNVKENILLQTIAVATGTLPLAAGFVGVIPALGMVDPDLDGMEPVIFGWWQCVCWAAAIAFFGVFLAVPLRRQVILKEQLVFPSGTATAQVLSVLHDKPIRASDKEDLPNDEEVHDDEAPLDATTTNSPRLDFEISSWKPLTYGFLASAIYSLLTIFVPVLYSIPVFDIIGVPMASEWLWWWSPSMSYVGQGIIMGFEPSYSMVLGMILGWGVLSPLAKYKGWAPGPIQSASNGSRGWIMWPALAIMMAESITSLAATVVSSFWQRGGRSKRRGEARSHYEDPKMTWVMGGFAFSTILCIVLLWVLFHNRDDAITWWATLIALLLASVFSLLGVRALGTTDLNPVSAVGKISQLLFPFIQGGIVPNLIAGGISEAGAQQAGDLMQDLKCGHLLDASPKVQFMGQLLGSFASIFISSTVYVLYQKSYEIGGTTFPAPTATIWLNLARLVNHGHLPPKTPHVMVVFGILFFFLSLIKLRTGRHTKGGRIAQWIPSGIAFSIGLINTPSFTLARFLGGCIALWRAKRHGSSSALDDLPLILVASGLVLGEGVISIVGLGLNSAGVGPLTCAGCNLGSGGYCGKGMRRSIRIG